MALTLAEYNSTKSMPGAWPPNPVLSPTFIMLVVSCVNVLMDAINILVQCCGVRVLRTVTGVVTAIMPAIAAGLFKFARDLNLLNLLILQAELTGLRTELNMAAGGIVEIDQGSIISHGIESEIDDERRGKIESRQRFYRNSGKSYRNTVSLSNFALCKLLQCEKRLFPT